MFDGLETKVLERPRADAEAIAVVQARAMATVEVDDAV
jgi:hypothetical protein